MAYQDVMLLLFQASFHSTFLKNCGRGNSCGIAICLKTCGWA